MPPCRLRSSSASKRGLPQSPPAGNGAARNSQRVSAVVGAGRAAWRSVKAAMPCFAVARVNLRLATRSKAFVPPQSSITTAPSPWQFSPSAPERRAAAALGTFTISKRAGSKPKASRPVPRISPHSNAGKSCCTQSSHLLFRISRAASASTKPEAVGASAAVAGKISCSAPQFRPPLRQRSAPGWPKLRISPVEG
jgi:hypothetical protein